MIEPDLFLKATLFEAIYPVGQTDDAETFCNPWNAAVVKAVDDGAGDLPDPASQMFALAKRDVATEGCHDATGHFSSVEGDRKIIDEAWEELIGSHAKPAAKAATHPDGIELEKCGRQLWKWHWKDGKVGRSEVTDPELPGGHLILDEHCNEIAA